MKKFGVIGEIAAGKTTLTNYLKNHYAAATLRFSDPLRDVAKRLHLEPTRPNLQNLSTVLRRAFGDDLFSKVIASDAAASTQPLIVIEGIRRPSDVTHLSGLPGFRLIYITAAARTRFARLKDRSENPDDGSKTWEQFQIEATQESEQQIKAIAAQADVTINNNGTREELEREIEKILNP